MADPRGERAAAMTLRPARPDDRERCAAIAVAAWTPIYAHRRATLGESLFDRLHPRWAEDKAGEIRADSSTTSTGSSWPRPLLPAKRRPTWWRS